MIQIQPPLPFPSPPRLLLANEFYSKLISYGIARIRKTASNVVNFFFLLFPYLQVTILNPSVSHKQYQRNFRLRNHVLVFCLTCLPEINYGTCIQRPRSNIKSWIVIALLLYWYIQTTQTTKHSYLWKYSNLNAKFTTYIHVCNNIFLYNSKSAVRS